MEPFVPMDAHDGTKVFQIRDWLDKIPNLSVGFTSRDGGISVKPWSSLNCALHVGDSLEAVVENRKRLSAAAGFRFDAWTCAEQTHGSQVRVVAGSDAGAGRTSREDAFADTDGLVTNQPGIMLAAFYADCVPLFFADPVRRAVGIAHAGWKGTALQIAIRTAEKMTEAFGTRPEDLYAAIGPSIGPCCYEVDERVVQEIGLTYPERKDNGRYMLDLKEANRQFMIRAGIKPNNIELTSYCTCCRTDLFFSHRGENGSTGRMTAWIGMKDEVTR